MAGWVYSIFIILTVTFIAMALWRWGATEVRGQFMEVIFLTVLGGFWLLFSIQLFSWLGLSVRDDIVERQNPGALAALCGATLSVGMSYAGGSLGEGSSYSENFFSAALGTAGLFVFWLVLELGGKISISIAEERDLASGLRFFGFMLAAGLILARAIAGNWYSTGGTIRDFLQDGWPAVILCALAIGVEKLVRPNAKRPFPNWLSSGLLPGAVYIFFGSVWVAHLGRWEGMPR